MGLLKWAVYGVLALVVLVVFLLLGWLLALVVPVFLWRDWFRARSQLVSRLPALAGLPAGGLALLSLVLVGGGWFGMVAALPKSERAQREQALGSTPTAIVAGIQQSAPVNASPTSTIAPPTMTPVPPAPTATVARPTPTPLPTATPTPKRLATGQQGTAKSDTLAAVDDPSWDAMWKAITAKDQMGITELMLRGKVFMISQGTKVQAIDSSFTATKVRVLDGSHIGKAGWVPYEMVGP